MTLTSTTIEASVVDPSKNSQLKLLLKDTDWFHWLMIEQHTLMELREEARLYHETSSILEDAQDELEESVEEVNFLKKDNVSLHRENNKLKKENFNLKHPPWYRQPVVWGASGLACGVVLVFVSLALGGAL